MDTEGVRNHPVENKGSWSLQSPLKEEENDILDNEALREDPVNNLDDVFLIIAQEPNQISLLQLLK